MPYTGWLVRASIPLAPLETTGVCTASPQCHADNMWAHGHTVLRHGRFLRCTAQEFLSCASAHFHRRGRSIPSTSTLSSGGTGV